jgi:hypothetical protein
MECDKERKLQEQYAKRREDVQDFLHTNIENYPKQLGR